MDSSGRRNRGLLSGDDMAAFSASYERPVTFEHRGLTVCKAGPWSQGPVQLQALALLEGFDLEAMGHLSADYVHTVLECAKLAFADREAWYGDPAFADVPLETLVSRAYAAERRALVGEEASFDLRPGSPDGRSPVLPPIPAVAEAVAAGFGVGEPTLGRADGPAEGDTCHVDVVDRHGNMVSATPSGGWLHSSPAIPGLGLCLGTRAQMFWLTEGLPNALAPGKRPRTTLTPSLGLRDGEGVLAWGTPGGDGQDQWSLQFLLSHLDFGLQPAGGDRRAGVHVDALPVVVLPAARGARARGDRVACRPGRDRGAAGARARRRGRRAVVDRAAERREPVAGRDVAGGGEPARDAGVRGRALSGLRVRARWRLARGGPLVASPSCGSASPSRATRPGGPRRRCWRWARRSRSASRGGRPSTRARICPAEATSSPRSAGPRSRSAGPWLAVAWAVGAVVGRPVRAAVAGGAGLALGTFAWYAASALAGGPAEDYARVAPAWAAVALAAGAVFGLAGAAFARGGLAMRTAALALVSGTLAGEALLLFSEWTGRASRAALAAELAVAGAVLVLGARRTAPLAALVLAALVAVGVAGAEGAVRDTLRLAGWRGL